MLGIKPLKITKRSRLRSICEKRLSLETIASHFSCEYVSQIHLADESILICMHTFYFLWIRRVFLLLLFVKLLSRSDSFYQQLSPFRCIRQDFLINLRIRDAFDHGLKIQHQNSSEYFKSTFSFFTPAME